MNSSAPSSHRLRDLRRPPWIAGAAVVVVLGSAMLSLGSVGSSSNESYTLVRRGDVTAEVSAAGTVQSADTRQLAFASTGIVTAIDVKIGQSVSAGQVLATLDDTTAKDQVTVAEAALSLANASYAQVEAGGSPITTASSGTSGTAGSSGSSGSSGNSGSSGGCSSATGTGGSTTTTQAAAAAFVGPHASPAPSPTPSPTTPSPATPSPATPTPSTSPTTPTPPSTSPSIPPTRSPRPTPSGKPKHPKPKPTKPGKGKGKGSKGGKSGSKPKTKSSSCATSGDPLATAAAKVTEAEVAVRQAERTLEGTEIKAPMSGTVLALNGTVGQQISGAGATGFLTLGNLEDLQVQAMFSLNDVNELRIGQQATITFGYRPDQRYTGTVTSIAPAATVNGSLALFGVMLSLDNPPAGLMVGMTAATQVVTAQAGSALYVPETAVRTAPNGTTTVLVRHGGHTLVRNVTTGVHGDRYVAITSGLVAGDQVDTSTDTSVDTFPVSG